MKLTLKLGRVVLACLGMLSASLLAWSRPAAAQDDLPQAPQRVQAPDPDEVDAAIRRGVMYLYRQRDPDLQWETVPLREREPETSGETGERIGPVKPHGSDGGQWGGPTSLVTYALLVAGEDYQNQDLTEAVAFLKRHRDDMVGVYGVAMRAQVWLNLPETPENQQMMLRDATFLREAVQGNERGMPLKKNTGLFDYLVRETERVDISVSQYGVLGLWAAAKYGLEVSPEYWRVMEKAWLRYRQPDGGWAYNGEPRVQPDGNSEDRFAGFHPTSVPMTCAGVASLYITQDYLHAKDGVACRGNYVNPSIDAGLRFIVEGFPYLIDKKPTPDDNLVAQVKAWGGHHRMYTLYGIERIGVASGMKYFGDLDWYAEGARYILDRQESSGGWSNPTDTAFALLFLSYGRQPVFANKLVFQTSRPDLKDLQAEVEPGERDLAGWNQRSRDLANLARYIADVDERELNWQSLNFPTGEDAYLELHDAPILYIAASDFVNFTARERDVMRQYVDTGGLILGNADCGSKKFAESFKRLGTQLFGDRAGEISTEEGGNYEWRVLPDDHPIYLEQKFNLKEVRRKPRILALGNGVRELMLLVDKQDLGRSWQLADRNKTVPFQVGANIYLYAIDKQRQEYKGKTHVVVRDDTAKPDKTLKLARVRHGGNWNPEPGGWQQLGNVLANDSVLDLAVEPSDAEDLVAGEFDVAHLTGTEALSLTDAQKQGLQAFVEQGGTLVVDAAGGSAAFTTSTELLLPELFGEDAADALRQPLPMRHAIYTSGDEPIEEVSYRLYALKALGNENKPRLRGIETGGRLAVIVSNEDLSNGLVGSPVDGVVGYTPADATRLMSAVLQYVAEQK